MAYRFFLAGVEIQCDELEELLKAVRAGVTDSMETKTNTEAKPNNGEGPRKAWEAAKAVAEEEGISPLEAHGRLASSKKSKQSQVKGPQGKGPRKAWAEATAYAEKHNVSVIEARGILSHRKKLALAKALDNIES